jgi:hypothetical protein
MKKIDGEGLIFIPYSGMLDEMQANSDRGDKMTDETGVIEMTEEKTPRKRQAKPTSGPKNKPKKPVEEPEIKLESKPEPEPEPEVKKEKPPVKPVDILIWIGRRDFATIDDAIYSITEEGHRSKLSKVPRNFEIGKSRIFLAHDEGNRGDAVIFGYYIPDSIVLDVDEDGGMGERKRQVPKFVTHLFSEGNSPGDMWFMLEEATDDNFISFDVASFRDYNLLVDPEARRFRGYKAIDGDEILASTEFKNAPSERLDDGYSVEVGSHPLPHARWTEEEDIAFEKLLEETLTKTQAFQIFARKTERTELGVSYHYYRKLEKAKKAGEASPELKEVIGSAGSLDDDA